MRNKKTLLVLLLALALICITTLAFVACDDSGSETDKTALQTAITSAEAVKAADGYEGYTEISRTAFEQALSAAKTVNGNESATQSQIDTAKNNLVTAQGNLTLPTPPVVDKTALAAAISEAQGILEDEDYEDYTEESRTAFEQALSAAEAVNSDADATQAEVDEAKEDLITAKEGLTIPLVDNFDEYAGLLMIWQVGVAQVKADKVGAITRNFIELYNNSDDDINLDGYSIQYANDNGASWLAIPLTGTIKSHTSFLILGDEADLTDVTATDKRLFLNDAEGDFLYSFRLSNDQYKICLIKGSDVLTDINPFNIDGRGTVAAGYVDFVGAVNGVTIDAYEGAWPVAKMSKQQSARRTSLIDTNNNVADFTNIDYRISGISDEAMEDFRPKNQAYGAWNPVTFESLE